MFLVIEGIDGSGKTTQVELLSQLLTQAGKTVKIFDFPRYTEESSYFVKKFLNGEYGKDISPKLISLFFALDRFDASKEIREAIKIYDYVLSNRYVTSNMVHQTARIFEQFSWWEWEKIAAKEFLDWIIETEYQLCWIPLPDAVFFLDVPPRITRELLLWKHQREYIKVGNKDINELDENHQNFAYEAALFVADTYNWHKINCLKNDKLLSKELITQKILKNIS